jgi:hypothetical protein
MVIGYFGPSYCFFSVFFVEAAFSRIISHEGTKPRRKTLKIMTFSLRVFVALCENRFFKNASFLEAGKKVGHGQY